MNWKGDGYGPVQHLELPVGDSQDPEFKELLPVTRLIILVIYIYMCIVYNYIYNIYIYLHIHIYVMIYYDIHI